MPRDAGQRATIYDVARRAGVSKSLVSRVLQGSARVSDESRAAVLLAITELGYRPSQAATALASRRTRNIELVLEDFRNLWFVELLSGMRAPLAAGGYHLTVSDAQLNTHTSLERQSNIVSANLDGLVLATDADNPDLDLWSGPTVVAGWRTALPPSADLITNDDEQGGRMAVQHLVALGHRRIGHLTGDGGPAGHRRNGYLAGMTEAGLEPTVTSGTGGTSEDDGYMTASTLLNDDRGITAIFAANDIMAVGALAAVRAHGLSVPADVSLIGYDNSPLSRYRYLDLTSVDARNEIVGSAAAQALLERIADPTIPARRTLVPPILQERATTVPLLH